jgi:DNA topoisomerase IA
VSEPHDEAIAWFVHELQIKGISTEASIACIYRTLMDRHMAYVISREPGPNGKTETLGQVFERHFGGKITGFERANKK